MHSFDLRDYDKTEHLFAAEGFDAVIHFAGFKAVGESVAKPLDYYENNLGSTFSLVRAMQRYDVDKLVFSSSATVYGTDQAGATEDRRTFATNPYGWTKVMQEQILTDVALAAPQMRFALLRYFNPVGAHASGTIGEDPSETPNNLMPYIAQVAVGRRDKLQVFGDDYDTPDGTGVRDYIHVEDLAAGHVAALEALTTTDEPVNVWNLGSGRGTSVLELLHAFEKAVGRELPYEVVRAPPRRRGVVVRRPVQGQRRARLAHHPVGRGDVRRHLALAVAEPRGLHRLMLGHPAGCPSRRRRRAAAAGRHDRGRSTPATSWATPTSPPRSTGRSPRAASPSRATRRARRPTAATRRRPSPGRSPGGCARGWSTSGATVVMTRTSNRADRWGPCVDVRGRAGNRIDADLKVSIHGDGSYAAGARGFHVIAPASRAGWTDDIARPSMALARVRPGRAGARRRCRWPLHRRRRRARRPLRPGHPQPLRRPDRDGRARQHAPPRATPAG